MREQIWDSLAAESTVASLSGAQWAELDRRLADYDAYPDGVVTWDDAEASIVSRLGE